MAALRSNRDTRAKLVVDNHYLENAEAGFGLLSKLISAPETKPEIAQELEKLEKLIYQDFMELTKRQNLPNGAEMFEKLKKAYEDLEDLAEFSALANKNIVAIGGGFSSGKSRFINSILGDDLLPIATTPTTAIPSYIGKGKEEAIYALNTFNTKAHIDREAIKAISHAFNEKYNVSFSHIIKILMMEKISFPYDNIVLLDTPGYSKSDSLIKGNNTDEKIARGHLAQADHLIWVVDAPKGTIPDMDIQFIKSLNYEGEIFIIVNKADQRPLDEIPSIMEVIKERLSTVNINICGILAYNSAAKENNELMGDSIKEFLDKTNEKIKYKKTKQTFREIFEIFIQYNQQQLLETKEMLKYLNELYLTQDEKIEDESADKLKRIIENNKNNLKKLSTVIGQFESLSTKVEEIVVGIMSQLKVKEENRRDGGIVGNATLRDEKLLANLMERTILQGRVTKVNAFGVFIDCGLGDSIMLPIESVKAKYTEKPQGVFNKDRVCNVEVIEIQRKNKKAIVVVNPILDN